PPTGIDLGLGPRWGGEAIELAGAHIGRATDQMREQLADVPCRRAGHIAVQLLAPEGRRQPADSVRTSGVDRSYLVSRGAFAHVTEAIYATWVASASVTTR